MDMRNTEAFKTFVQDSLNVFKAKARPPQDALKTIEYGNLKGKSDINPQWRIEALTEQFGLYGVGWYAEILNTEFHDVPDRSEKMVFMTVALYVRDWTVKDAVAWSKPAIGCGGDFVVVKDKNGIHGNDEAFAMCFTDALGKAAKFLGIANDIYRAKYDSKYGWKDERARKDAETAKSAQNESYRLIGGDVQVNTQNGYVSISKLSKAQLTAIVNFNKFADIKSFIEEEIKKK